STALLLTVVYAFATPTWSTSSQALWQHGASEFLITSGLLGLVLASETSGCIPAAQAGFCAGLSVAVRPSNAIFLAIVAIYVCCSRWSMARIVAFAVCAAVPVGVLVVYNFAMFGSAAGSYPAGWLLHGN